MRISKKGLYALVAMTKLAANYARGGHLTKTHDLASLEDIPEKFLELILLQLKTARLVESVRGAQGGYRLSRAPSKIFLGEIIRTIDGPLAPFGNAASLRRLVASDKRHSALYRVFLDVRNAASRILDHTSLADLCRRQRRGRLGEGR
jgi:Rrf2 family cysteine metabolism transcriptional repressor